MTQIPLYRAKKIDSDEYVVGDLIKKRGWFLIAIQDTIDSNNAYDLLTFVDNGNIFEIGPSTLSIHFPDMLDSQGNKIFASLSEDGRGGSLVVTKSYPFYGDAPEITNSSGKCEELNYKGVMCFSSNGCYLDYIKVSDRVRGNAIGGLIEEFNEYEAIGIQQ